MSIVSVADVIGEKVSLVVFNSWCQIFGNLIGWTLTNAGKVTLELNLSQHQQHPNARDTTPASYCEPTLSATTDVAAWQFAMRPLILINDHLQIRVI